MGRPDPELDHARSNRHVNWDMCTNGQNVDTSGPRIRTGARSTDRDQDAPRSPRSYFHLRRKNGPVDFKRVQGRARQTPTWRPFSQTPIPWGLPDQVARSRSGTRRAMGATAPSSGCPEDVPTWDWHAVCWGVEIPTAPLSGSRQCPPWGTLERNPGLSHIEKPRSNSGCLKMRTRPARHRRRGS